MPGPAPRFRYAASGLPLAVKFAWHVASRWMNPPIYGEACGWVLARAHAKGGDPWAISGYLGKNAQFDEAMGKFALAYADQAERDHAALRAAVRAGIVEVQLEH